MKPTTLRAVYKVNLEFCVEDIEQKFGISWDDVKDWYVKYASLNIVMDDGTVLKMDPPDMNEHTDWKHPESEDELDNLGYEIT